MFWFNPVVWLLAWQAHELREEAAEDVVLRGDILPGFRKLRVVCCQADEISRLKGNQAVGDLIKGSPAQLPEIRVPLRQA